MPFKKIEMKLKFEKNLHLRRNYCHYVYGPWNFIKGKEIFTIYSTIICTLYLLLKCRYLCKFIIFTSVCKQMGPKQKYVSLTKFCYALDIFYILYIVCTFHKILYVLINLLIIKSWMYIFILVVFCCKGNTFISMFQ